MRIHIFISTIDLQHIHDQHVGHMIHIIATSTIIILATCRQDYSATFMEQYRFDNRMVSFFFWFIICVSKHLAEITLSRPCLAKLKFIILYISELICKSTLLRSDVDQGIHMQKIEPEQIDGTMPLASGLQGGVRCRAYEVCTTSVCSANLQWQL